MALGDDGVYGGWWLTDIFENNTLDEDQISGIYWEVSISFDYFLSGLYFDLFFFFSRRVRDWHIYTAKASSIEISSLIMFSLTLKAESRLVRLLFPHETRG